MLVMYFEAAEDKRSHDHWAFHRFSTVCYIFGFEFNFGL